MTAAKAPRPLLLLRDLSASQYLPLPSKEEAARDFQQWLLQTGTGDIVIYSDGSQAEDSAVGWGYTIFTGNMLHAARHGRLGPAEVFDAEICGALAGLQAAIQQYPPNASRKYFVCIDSTSAIQSLLGTPQNHHKQKHYPSSNS